MCDADEQVSAKTVVEWARRSMPSVYVSLLEDMIAKAEDNEHIGGFLLTGSMARCDALPGTDIDVWYILRSADQPTFHRGFCNDILVEQTHTTENAAQAELADNPMQVYAYLDGVSLYDPVGSLARLRRQAYDVYHSYRMPQTAKRAIADALRHPEDKIRIGLQNNDLLKATFCLGTTSWQLIEGLWAANDLPLPPNGSIRPHVRDLPGPPNVEALFQRLFLAGSVERAEAALHLLSWVREQLNAPTASIH